MSTPSVALTRSRAGHIVERNFAGRAALTTIGHGKFTYEWVEGWGKLPEGWPKLGQCGVVTDSQDRVYCFKPERPSPGGL